MSTLEVSKTPLPGRQGTKKKAKGKSSSKKKIITPGSNSDAFAWSKSQNSPDPSSLPYPNFLKKKSIDDVKQNLSVPIEKSNKEDDRTRLLKESFSNLMKTARCEVLTEEERTESKISSLKDALGIGGLQLS